MIEVGKKQILRIANEDQSGLYLVCKDNFEVFMPGVFAKDHMVVGDMIEVYVYLDKEFNELATSILPEYEVGDLACLKVKSTTSHGAYLDMGTPRDLFIPKNLQKISMKINEVYLVKILKEDESNRIFGTSDVIPELETSCELTLNQMVEIRPFHSTPLGYKVLINKQNIGMIYHNEIFEDITLGTIYTAYVKNIRTSDGRIDLSLQRSGLTASEINQEKILKALSLNHGKMHLCDRSSPQEIQDTLKMSKGAFKKAIGSLYKRNLIQLEKSYISIND